jgi:hypothetical protein
MRGRSMDKEVMEVRDHHTSCHPLLAVRDIYIYRGKKYTKVYTKYRSKTGAKLLTINIKRIWHKSVRCIKTIISLTSPFPMIVKDFSHNGENDEHTWRLFWRRKKSWPYQRELLTLKLIDLLFFFSSFLPSYNTSHLLSYICYFTE